MKHLSILMTITSAIGLYLDLDPDWLYMILMMGSMGLTAFVELRRTRNIDPDEINQIKQDIVVLQTTTVSVEDWADMRARQQYVDRMLNKMVDEWEGAEHASDDG